MKQSLRAYWQKRLEQNTLFLKYPTKIFLKIWNNGKYNLFENLEVLKIDLWVNLDLLKI